MEHFLRYKILLEECIKIPLNILIAPTLKIIPSLINVEVRDDDCKTSYFTAYLKYGIYEWSIKKYKIKLLQFCANLEKKNIIIEAYKKNKNVFSLSKTEILEIIYEIFNNQSILKINDVFLFFRISEFSFFGPRIYEETFYVLSTDLNNSKICCNFFSKKLYKSFYIICKTTHLILYDYKNEKKIEKIIFFTKDTEFKLINGPIYSKMVIIDNNIKINITSLMRQRVKDLHYEMLKKITSFSSNIKSYAPLRFNNICNFYIDGKNYFLDLYNSLKNAKSEIFIAGWWIFPGLYLKRKNGLQKKHRLDNLLKKKARQNVKIYILIYHEISFAVNINSDYTYNIFNNLHHNVNIIRHPNNTPNTFIYWTHHEKLVIIDQKIAYTGGIDLCLGRYDTSEHLLFEKIYDKHKQKWYVWPGKDFSNPLRKDFIGLEKADICLIDRKNTPRMPWHDIQTKIIGDTAFDIALHFIQRWNYLSDKIIVPNESFFYNNIQEMYPFVTCQALRSIGMWSYESQTENSIYLAYINLIRNTKKFLYIENQFFITKFVKGDISDPQNLLGFEIFKKIKNAYENNIKFKVYIVIPLLPAFELDLCNSVMAHILRIQTDCIYRNKNSFINVLKQAGIDYKKYVIFLSLKKFHKSIYDVCNFKHEQIYVHSKIIISDGLKMITGSANINDRSLLGDRDTESCIYVEDFKFNQINDLLKKLLHEHLDFKKIKIYKKKHKQIYKLLKCNILDLSNDSIFFEIKKIAKSNSKLYFDVFKCFSNNHVINKKIYYEIKSMKPNLKNKKFKKIIGNLVLYPYKFLCEEEFDGGIFSLDRIIPEFIYF